MKNENYFSLKYEAFKNLLKDESPAYFITFRYMLPFHFPLSENEALILDDILFWSSHREYEHYALKDGGGHGPVHHTIIEATLKIDRRKKRRIEQDSKKTRGSTQDISLLFDKQFDVLNTFIDVVAVKEQYHNIYTLSRAELISIPSYKLYTYKKDEPINNNTKGLIWTDKTDKISKDNYETLTGEKLKGLIKNYKAHISNPYRHIAHLARKGERAYFLHDYNNAIVHYNTSFEVLLATFVRRYYSILGIKTEAEVHNVLAAGLKNIKNDHFIKIVEWLDLKDQSLISELIESYWKTGYEYRNKIVHQGELYTKAEASRTMQAYEKFTSCLTAKIWERKRGSANQFVDDYTSYLS